MATNINPTKPAVRSLLHGQVGEIRMSVGFADVFPSVMRAAVPAGAQIVATVVTVTQAFNGGAPALVVGSTPGGNDLVAAADSVAGTVGVKRPDTATALGRLSADTVPYVSVSATGTPSQGAAEVVFLYVSPRA